GSAAAARARAAWRTRRSGPHGPRPVPAPATRGGCRGRRAPSTSGCRRSCLGGDLPGGDVPCVAQGLDQLAAGLDRLGVLAHVGLYDLSDEVLVQRGEARAARPQLRLE